MSKKTKVSTAVPEVELLLRSAALSSRIHLRRRRMSVSHGRHRRSGLDHPGSTSAPGLHWSHTQAPHRRQWWQRERRLKGALHSEQDDRSGAHSDLGIEYSRP